MGLWFGRIELPHKISFGTRGDRCQFRMPPSLRAPRTRSPVTMGFPACWRCLLGFRTCDAERGDGRDRLAAQAGDVPLDEEHLADVRERRVIGGGQDLDGTGGDPAVALVGGGLSDRDLVPWQRVEGV